MSKNKIIVSGKVIFGKGKGRDLGFPTANIFLDKSLPLGVYNAQVLIESKKYLAAAVILDDKLEVHILDFNQDIYDYNIQVILQKKIRDIIKFDDEKFLQSQIQQDIEIIKNLNNKNKHGI